MAIAGGVHDCILPEYALSALLLLVESSTLELTHNLLALR